jgi:hypothetical protein
MKSARVILFENRVARTSNCQTRFVANRTEKVLEVLKLFQVN